MTFNGRPESERFLACADGAQKATSTPERDEGGRHPARRLEPPIGTGGSRANNTTANDLEQAVRFAPRARDNGIEDLPDPPHMSPSSTRVESHSPQAGVLGALRGSLPRSTSTALSAPAG